MATNPLQSYFRQPKVYISLPSQGIYNKPGTLQGDVTNIPVYGMTGMDELIAKTPDAMISGESVIKVIESCCPAIKDAWDLSLIDLNIVLAAIRIATYGETMTMAHSCPKCSAVNEYDIDVNTIIEFYNQCKFDPDVNLKDIVIKLRPMSYRQSTDINLKNYQLQQQVAQIDNIENDEERKSATDQIFKQVTELTNDAYINGVDSVQTPQTTVTEHSWISEWLNNTDKSVFDAIKEQNLKNREAWTPKGFPVVCESCQSENKIYVDLDTSNFFD